MKREIIFKIDGSLDGILTAVYETFSKKLNQQNVDLRCQTDLIKQNLFSETIIIEKNSQKASKVLKKLKFLLNNGNYNRLFIAVKSGRENACQIIFSYTAPSAS